MTTRRELLSALGTALAGMLLPAGVLAASRVRYGGSLRLTLPIDTARIDPHDDSALSTHLLGSSLFDGLYARRGLDAAALPYPTLASAMPRKRGTALVISLRPGLRSARGTKLDAAAIATSLERSRSRSQALRDLWSARASSALELELKTDMNEHALALRLTAPDCVIVPPRFDPSRPDCTGALSASGPGIARLVRNGWAPRGGSYLAEIQLTSADLRTCLRDFETLKSDLGFLGSGLHQTRKSARQFALGSVGWLLLEPGRQLGRFAAPGALTQALGSLHRPDFAALGVDLIEAAGQGSWAGPPCSLLVNQDEPWLLAIATELARSWDSPQARVQVEPTSRAELDLRRKDRSFDCILSFLGASSPDEAFGALLALAGLPPPKRLLGTVSLEDAVRHLPFALAGRLSPRGFVDPHLADLVSPGTLDLANARFLP